MLKINLNELGPPFCLGLIISLGGSLREVGLTLIGTKLLYVARDASLVSP